MFLKMDKLLKEIDIKIQEVSLFDSEYDFKDYTSSFYNDFKLEDIKDVKAEGFPRGESQGFKSGRFYSTLHLNKIIGDLFNLKLKFYNKKDEVILDITVNIKDEKKIIFKEDNNGRVYRFKIKPTITIVPGIIKRIQFGLNNFGKILTQRGCESVDVETIERISNKISLQVDMKTYEIEFNEDEIINRPPPELSRT